MTTTDSIPRVYVGTFNKYNSGSIAGRWIDLDGHDSETFRKACLDLHSDEHDPEIMLQDFEGFPRSFYSESGLDPKVWEWLSLDERQREIVAAYAEALGSHDFDLSDALDRFVGEYDSGADYAQQLAEDMGAEIPSWMTVDWEATWENTLRHDFTSTHKDGSLWIFSN